MNDQAMVKLHLAPGGDKHAALQRLVAAEIPRAEQKDHHPVHLHGIRSEAYNSTR
jgi:hypothetical protein